MVVLERCMHFPVGLRYNNLGRHSRCYRTNWGKMCESLSSGHLNLCDSLNAQLGNRAELFLAAKFWVWRASQRHAWSVGRTLMKIWNQTTWAIKSPTHRAIQPYLMMLIAKSYWHSTQKSSWRLRLSWWNPRKWIINSRQLIFNRRRAYNALPRHWWLL